MSQPIALQLDEDFKGPIFLNLASSIIREIERGRLKPGAALPGTRLLSRSLGIHRNTVDAAYQELVVQGWVVSRPSKGTFVAEDLPDVMSKSKPSRRAASATQVLATEVDEPARLSFSDGTPDPRLAPRALLARAFRQALAGPAFLCGSSYGDPRGSMALRTALSDYLMRERGLVASADDLLVARGSQMALFLCARVLLAPGDVIAVEEPGYPLAWSAFRAAGAKVVGIPVDGQGISISGLRAVVDQEPRLRAVYVTPHHQYPTTVTMGAGRRLTLLDLAREHGLMVIEDDYDHEYRFDSKPVLPLVARSGPDLVLYLGSLSKLLAPGIRLGYAVASPRILHRIAIEREAIDRQGDLPLENAIAILMRDGELRRHARKARRVYAERRRFLAEELRRRLGSSITFDMPAGGLALWLRLTDGADAGQWAVAAARLGLALASGWQFCLDAASGPDAFRLGYASLDEDELRRAVDLLARAKP